MTLGGEAPSRDGFGRILLTCAPLTGLAASFPRFAFAVIFAATIFTGDVMVCNVNPFGIIALACCFNICLRGLFLTELR